MYVVSDCIGIINEVKYVLRKDFISSLYTSIIEPHLTYSVYVWGNVYKCYLNPLYVKKKHLIHFIYKSCFLDHLTNLFQCLNMLPFSFNKVQYGHFYV